MSPFVGPLLSNKFRTTNSTGSFPQPILPGIGFASNDWMKTGVEKAQEPPNFTNNQIGSLPQN
jgi:hypothetical protein